MKTTLREFRDYQDDLDNVFATRLIDEHIKGLFLELTCNIDFDLDRKQELSDDLWDFADLDEQYVSLDCEETIIPDNGMDVCVRIKFNLDATQHRESDGGRFFENESFDVTSIIFDVWGDEWYMSDDKDAIKFVNKVLNTWI